MKLHEIGSEIKRLRKDQGFTQEDLAEKAGISRVTMGKIEKGLMAGISVRTLDIILASLNYELDFRKINNFGLKNLDELA